MTRFSDLLKTNEVHSAYEDVDIIISSLNFNGMTKLQLESYGRTVGIELDRRYKKDKLIKQLEDHLATS
tara:strand:- start:290 stop:496 length:207 start_codon:yes stop_codon:yes gene_type:complete